METTDQNVHGESSEDMGPLLMHDPDDEDENHSLSSADQHNLLSDVHLPGGSEFITADVDKGHQLHSMDHSINVEKEDVTDKPASGDDAIEASSQEQAVSFKFTDGQPVTLEDGSTAYVLSTYKEGAQPIIFEDGATMYISHEPPSSKFDHSLDNPSLGMLHVFPPSIGDAEEKRLTAATQISSHDQKLFKCEYEGCQKVYTTYHHLQYHRRSHLERKPFVCGYSGCDKTFSTSYGLKSHIRVHTGEKPYKCPHTVICNKAFKTSGDLQKHIRIHTGEKPFRCPFQGCERSFTTSNIRKVHIRTHTGEKPYNCEECGKRFSSATNHRNHMRIHTGERPYACQHQGCTKRFTEYSSLYKHQVVHSTEKPYTCSQCGKLYRQASTLAMHKRTAHGDPDVVLREGDIMASQLIALEHGKGTVLSTEVVGLVSPHHKQYDGSRMVTSTSSAGRRSELQSLHFIDSNNVVVVTDPSCYKVVETQGARTTSETPEDMIYSTCLHDQVEPIQSSHAAHTAVGLQKTTATSDTEIMTRSIGLSSTAPPTDLSTESIS